MHPYMLCETGKETGENGVHFAKGGFFSLMLSDCCNVNEYILLRYIWYIYIPEIVSNILKNSIHVLIFEIS